MSKIILPSAAILGTGVGTALGNRFFVDRYNKKHGPKSFTELQKQYKDVKPGDVLMVRDSHMRGPSHTAVVSSKNRITEVLVPQRHKEVVRSTTLNKFLKDRAIKDGQFIPDQAIKFSDAFRPEKVNKSKLKRLSDSMVSKGKEFKVKYDPLANIVYNTTLEGVEKAKATCVSFTNSLLREAGAKTPKKAPVFPRSSVKGLNKITKIKAREAYTAPLGMMTAAAGVIALAKGKKKIGLPLMAAGVLANAVPVTRDADNYISSTATRMVGRNLKHTFSTNKKDQPNLDMGIGATALGVPSALGIAKLLK